MMWQSFVAIGRGTSEFGRWTKKHHGWNISPSGTVVPGGLKRKKKTEDLPLLRTGGLIKTLINVYYNNEEKDNERGKNCYLLNGKPGLSWSPFVHSVVRLGVHFTSAIDAAADDVDGWWVDVGVSAKSTAARFTRGLIATQATITPTMQWNHYNQIVYYLVGGLGRSERQFRTGIMFYLWCFFYLATISPISLSRSSCNFAAWSDTGWIL